MIANALPYVFWLVLVGCLIVASPVFGVLALVSGLALAAKVGH
jgi:hypothetical protein